MWKIKEVKKRAKKLTKKNIWIFILVTIFMSILAGEYVFNADGFSNIENLNQSIKNNVKIDELKDKATTIDKKDIIIEFSKRATSRALTGNATTLIEKYNEKHNIYKGVFFTIFNITSKNEAHIKNLLNSIFKLDDENTKLLYAIIILIVVYAIKIFLINPFLVGENRLYLESINYKRVKFGRLLYPFNRKRYINSMVTVLIMKIYKFLWNLTIVGGIIKNYSYKMCLYIIAENPNIKAKDAIKMSREMMNGNKLKAFKMDLSFIGWWILEYATFGIAGLYVSPYYKSSYTILYETLRKEYIENKKYNYELLNDKYLYDIELAKKDFKDEMKNGVLEKYPQERNKKLIIDYNKKYDILSIILFFFVFSIGGWIWEVLLFLVRDGKFINRGMMYGPWLPIYGFGCTFVIMLTYFKSFRKILKNPTLTFLIITLLCTALEYFTSWYTEKTLGVRYWDYTGVFMNINGRVCLEGAIFFGLGGSACIYFVAPFLEERIQKINKRKLIVVCVILCVTFFADHLYSTFHPHYGDGITENSNEPIVTEKKNVTILKKE